MCILSCVFFGPEGRTTLTALLEPIKVSVKTSENLQEQSGGHGGTDLAFKRQIHEYALM